MFSLKRSTAGSFALLFRELNPRLYDRILLPLSGSFQISDEHPRPLALYREIPPDCWFSSCCCSVCFSHRSCHTNRASFVSFWLFFSCFIFSSFPVLYVWLVFICFSESLVQVQETETVEFDHIVLHSIVLCCTLIAALNVHFPQTQPSFRKIAKNVGNFSEQTKQIACKRLLWHFARL